MHGRPGKNRILSDFGLKVLVHRQFQKFCFFSNLQSYTVLVLWIKIFLMTMFVCYIFDYMYLRVMFFGFCLNKRLRQEPKYICYFYKCCSLTEIEFLLSLLLYQKLIVLHVYFFFFFYGNCYHAKIAKRRGEIISTSWYAIVMIHPSISDVVNCNVCHSW